MFLTDVRFGLLWCNQSFSQHSQNKTLLRVTLGISVPKNLSWHHLFFSRVANVCQKMVRPLCDVCQPMPARRVMRRVKACRRMPPILQVKIMQVWLNVFSVFLTRVRKDFFLLKISVRLSPVLLWLRDDDSMFCVNWCHLKLSFHVELFYDLKVLVNTQLKLNFVEGLAWLLMWYRARGSKWS